MKTSLAGLTVLVTRPQPDNAQLCACIDAAGGKALAWPAVEVRPLPITVSMEQYVASRADYAGIIFVSANAVKYGIEYLMPVLSASASPQMLAVGKTTAHALRQYGVLAAYSEQGATSEAVLALPQLKSVQGQKWLIVRGRGGREILAETLKLRGAEVDYLEVYHRQPMPFPEVSLQNFLRHHAVSIIVFTSMALVEVFLRCWDGTADELFQLRILVVSERMQREATALGFGHIYLAASAYNEDVLTCLKQLQ